MCSLNLGVTYRKTRFLAAVALLLFVLYSQRVFGQTVKYSSIAKFDDANMGDIRRVSISPNGSRFALAIKYGTKEAMSIQGKKQAEFDRILRNTISWSQDGKQLIYAGERQGKHYVVQETKEYELVGKLDILGFSQNPMLSSDGSTLTWMERLPDGMRQVLNGKPGKVYSKISWAKFLGTSNKTTMVVKEGCLFRVVKDNVESQEYESVGIPIVSTSGQSVAYVASVPDGKQIIHDGVATPVMEKVENLQMSPDGKRIAYMEFQYSEAVSLMRIHVDGLPVEESECDTQSNIGRFVFSSNGSRVIYSFESCDSGYRVVVDQDKGNLYPFINCDSLTFSTDGTNYSYVAQKEDRKLVVVANKIEGHAYVEIVPNSLTYSATSTTPAYIVNTGTIENKTYSVNWNGKLSASFDEIQKLYFSPAGELTYVAKKLGKTYLVVGTKNIPLDVAAVYDQVPFVFSEAGLTLLGRKGVEFFRVDVSEVK